MKKNLLITLLSVMITTLGMAQSANWYRTLTTADGLPGIQDEEYGQYTFTTEVFKFDEPVSKFRITVISTNTCDKQEKGYGGTTGINGPAFPYFAMSELEVLKANGKRMGYNATSNAASVNSGGAIENIFDGSYDTNFLTTSYMGACPQAYHYIELEFDDPLSEFSIRWHSRTNGTSRASEYASTNVDNMPTHVGLTLGTEYLPYPEQGFTLGEKVTAVEKLKEKGFYVIEGHAPEYLHSFTGTKRTYPGGGFWHSPYGSHVTPNAGTAVYLIPESGKANSYKVAWLNANRYIMDGDALASDSYSLHWTKNENEAAIVRFTPCDTVPGDFILTLRDSLILGHNVLGKIKLVNHKPEVMTAYASTTTAWNFSIYKAQMNPATTSFLLGDAIKKAEGFIAEFGYNESLDEGEYEELTDLIEEGKAMITDAETTTADLIRARIELYEVMTSYATLIVNSYTDSIMSIYEAFEEGTYKTSKEPNWEVGTYPQNMLTKLVSVGDEIVDELDAAKCLADMENLMNKAKNEISLFWSYKIEAYNSFPIRIDEKDGLPGKVIEGEGGVWESRVFFFDKEVKGFRITVFETNTNNKYGNFDMFELSEIIVYDVNNKEITLTADNFTTNSINGNLNGMKYICDKNFYSFYTSATADGQDPNGYDGTSEYPYIEVTLPKAMSAFKYKHHGRGYIDAGIQDMPKSFAIGELGVKVTPDGTAINKVEVDGDEVISVTYYNAAGVSSPTPFNGLNIVKTVYANGVIKTNKKYVK